MKPRFDDADAVRIARDRFGLDSSAAPLPSERDRNFALTAADGRRFVLKIATTTEDRGVLDLQNQALLHLERHAPAVRLPRLVPASDGAYEAVESDATGRPHVVRLLTWVPGRVLADVSPHTADLLRGLGVMLGAIDRALASFDHPAAHRALKRDPAKAAWIEPYLQPPASRPSPAAE